MYIYIGIHPQNHLSNLVWECLGFMTDYQDSNLPEKGPPKSPWTSAPVEEKQIINHIATWNIRLSLSANNHGFCSLKLRIEYFSLDYLSSITRCSRSLFPRGWAEIPWSSLLGTSALFDTNRSWFLLRFIRCDTVLSCFIMIYPHFKICLIHHLKPPMFDA